MENICIRFPHVGTHILAILDPNSLRTFKKSSKIACKLVEDSRFFWISMIQKRFVRLVYNPNYTIFDGSLLDDRFIERNDLPEQWKEFVAQTPIEMLRRMTTAYESFSQLDSIDRFFKSYRTIQVLAYRQFDRNLTPLHIAAATGDTELCAYIIRKNHNKVPIGPPGLTPHHFAARLGNIEVYKVLLQNDGDNNPGNQHGVTPLYLAAAKGNLEMCTFLFGIIVEKSPRVHGCGDIPLGVAYRNNHMPVFLYIFENSGEKNPITNTHMGTTLLHDAVDKEDLETCALIIKNVSYPNSGDKKLFTPLHKAAIEGYFEVFKIIFENTIDKNPIDIYGKKPLDYTLKRRQDHPLVVERKTRIFNEFREHPLMTSLFWVDW